jgi:hypothetical protein
LLCISARGTETYTSIPRLKVTVSAEIKLLRNTGKQGDVIKLQTWLFEAFLLWTGHGDDEEMGSVSLPYDLSTLRAATDNFSEEKKLGEGGFGPVYKVISSTKPNS